MRHSPVIFFSILAQMASGASAFAAEGMPLLRVEPSLLGDGTIPMPPVVPSEPGRAGLRAAVIAAEPAQSITRAGANVTAPIPVVRQVGGHFIQIGAFAVQQNAETLRLRLTRTLGALGGKLLVRPSGRMFLLQLGPWPDAAAARRGRKQLLAIHKIGPLHIVAYPSTDLPPKRLRRQ